MFGGIKSMMDQFALAQKLMQNPDFKAFMAHPKVQALFQSEEFKKIMQSKDQQKIMAYKPLMDTMKDPEVMKLLSKLNPKDLQSLLGA